MESEPSSTPKLPLFSIRPEPPGMVPSPLHTSASVPFRWEEEPGKPRRCTTLPTNGPPKSLDLPPRLMIMDSKITKLPSPTTVLDGPCIMPKHTRFSSSSFRLSREAQGQGQGQGWSFDSGNNKSPEAGQFGPMVLEKRLGHKGKGLFGSWRQRALKVKGGKDEDVGGNLVFSSSMEVVGCGEVENVKVERTRRNGSLSSLSKPRSHFWAAIYEGIKATIPWRSRKSKREGFII